MTHEDDDDFNKPAISFISDKRTSQQSKMYNIDEDLTTADENCNNSNGEEMILTATKLTSQAIPSSASDNNVYVSSSPQANMSRC